MSIPASLPTLYAKWVPDLLGGEIPAESAATCDTCAMVVSEGANGDVGFNPATKCCTYLPILWNFLIGGVLLDDDPAAAKGRATAEARIDRGLGVTPLGLRRDPTYDLLYEHGGAKSFGQSDSMLCPHYLAESGGCGVWRHRESTCMTWFCKYVRGEVGRTFWMQLQQLLREVEETVAAWCVLQLGMGDESLSRLFKVHRDRRELTAHDLDRKPNVADTAALWGAWVERQREFYVQCARLVAPLVWADVLRIGGARVQVYAHTTRVAYEHLLNTAPPERPEVALVQITPRPGGRARLTTYSGTDVLEVSSTVTRILPHFDGRPLTEALTKILQAERVNVDPALVRKLADFGVLRNAVTGAPVER